MVKPTPPLKFSALLRNCIIGFILLFGKPLQAEPPANADNRTVWQLWAKPRICVMPSNRRQCHMETDIIWSGLKTADICLLSSQKNASLRCWRNAQGGHVLQTIASNKPITYWLTRPGEDKVLVETRIRIVSIPPKRVRRRRRHIWSLL